MSLETNQWAKLSQLQADFFVAQTEAVSQAVFSSVAQEAGIITRAASRYAFRAGPNAQMFGAIMWPDPYENNMACVVMRGAQGGNVPLAFARIAATDESYSVEGVGMRLDYGNAALHGRQLILRHDVADLSAPQVGAEFLASAIRKASEAKQSTIYPLGSPKLGLSVPEMIGIKGSTVARLFRSLGSLSANLLVTGVTGEKGLPMDQAYDLAQALLKMTIIDLADQKVPGAGNVLWAPSGVPLGAVFESERYGMAVVRRTDEAPDTIALATASRPKVDDDTIFVEQHSIQAGRVLADVLTLPAEAYDPRIILTALAMAEVHAREDEATPRIDLGKASCHALEQKIMRLLGERIAQRA